MIYMTFPYILHKLVRSTEISFQGAEMWLNLCGMDKVDIHKIARPLSFVNIGMT